MDANREKKVLLQPQRQKQTVASVVGASVSASVTNRGSREALSESQPLSAELLSAPLLLHVSLAHTQHPVLISSRCPLKQCLLVLSALTLECRHPAIGFPYTASSMYH